MSTSNWDSARWERVSELFEQAIELEAAERIALVKRIERDDPEVAMTLQKMLIADGSFDTHSPPSVGAVFDLAMDPSLPVGTQLGAYAIDSSLGVGGMGRVYKAHRVEGDVSQIVAIKCLRFADRDPEFNRRFLRERRILASLTHPNIARFLDAGTDTNGQPFVALEYVDGLAITDYARQQRLGIVARLQLLLKVMSAIAYSHRQLIVHRDIKPGNVLVDHDGEPRLLDFGIAKSLSAHAGVVLDEHETGMDQRVFSLAHAAPEQLRNTAITTACDVYALGVLAYELLAGQVPHAVHGMSFADAEREILERFPRPPSERIEFAKLEPENADPNSWRKALQGDLDNIVLHALKKAPNERYATVEAFMQDIQRHLQSEPISLRGGQNLYRAKLFVRRNQLAVALTGTLLIAVALGGAALWRQYLATTVQRDAAIAQNRRAEALNSLLLSAFEAADPSRNRGNEVSAREVLDQAARRVTTGEMDAATRVSLLTTVADVYLTLGLAKESEAAAINATRLGADAPVLLLAKAWRAAAQAKIALSEIEAAETALGTAAVLLINEKTPSATIEKFEQEQVALKILIGRGRAPETLDRYAALYKKASSEFGAASEYAIRFGADYATQLRILNRPKDSAPLIDELLRAIPDPEHTALGVRLLEEKSLSNRTLLRPLQAEQYANRYMKGVRLLYGDAHPTYARALGLLGKIEQDKGNFEQAIKLHNKGLAVLARISNFRDSTAQALALNNLANLLNKAGQLDSAKQTAMKSVQMGLRTYTPGNNNIAAFRTTLAEILLQRKEYAAAIEQLDQSDELFAANLSVNSPGVVRASGQILRGEALFALGRRSEAESAFSRGWQKLGSLDPSDWRRQKALQLRQRLDVARSD